MNINSLHLKSAFPWSVVEMLRQYPVMVPSGEAWYILVDAKTVQRYVFEAFLRCTIINNLMAVGCFFCILETLMKGIVNNRDMFKQVTHRSKSYIWYATVDGVLNPINMVCIWTGKRTWNAMNQIRLSFGAYTKGLLTINNYSLGCPPFSGIVTTRIMTIITCFVGDTFTFNYWLLLGITGRGDNPSYSSQYPTRFVDECPPQRSKWWHHPISLVCLFGSLKFFGFFSFAP